MKNNTVSLLSTMAAVALATLVTLGAAPVMAQSEKPAGTASASVTRTATVTKIDKTDRWITLKLEDGTLTEIHAGPAVKNFDQIKVGDKVTAQQDETLAVAVVAGGEAAPNAVSGASVVTAAPGDKPMAVMVERTTVTGKVTAIDYGKRSVTLLGPAGNSRTIQVGADVQKFDAIKQGDNVVLTLKTATSIEVTAPSKGGTTMKPAN